MIFQGEKLSCQRIEGDFAELRLDAKEQSINKLDQTTLAELAQAVEAVKNESTIKGLIFTSAKDAFIVGADINAFLGYFEAPAEEFEEHMWFTHKLFNTIEDLEIPTVCAIDGLALGGGMELALSTDYRILSNRAVVGLPEVKLGIFPGWGGTIRLPRLIGADNAIEWIASGQNNKAKAAQAVGVADAVVAPELLKEAAINTLKNAVAGKFDWKSRKVVKKSPLLLNQIEAGLAFETSKAFVAGKAGPHYPAPVTAIKSMQATAGMERDAAQKIECKNFLKVAKTDVTKNLIGIFLNDQFLKRQAKKLTEVAKDIKKAGVLGAGIMGGGICYQSASKGVPVVMKDIQQPALDLGLAEATKLLNKQVGRKKITPEQMAGTLNQIQASLSYDSIKDVDIIVEAVVENAKIKKSVITELEEKVANDTVIASNTSTISITGLAKGMKFPERFVGMHFFTMTQRQ